MENTLGYSNYERTSQKKANARNDSYPKTVTSSYGDIDLSIPRDRAGKYTPIIVAKGQTDISGIEKRLSVYMALEIRPETSLSILRNYTA